MVDLLAALAVGEPKRAARAACPRRSRRPPARRARPGPPGTARTRRRRGRTPGRRGRRARTRSRPRRVSTTSPAASWPSAIGITRGRLPLMTDRSEWQSPAARTLISSSPGPGGVELELDDLERPRLGVRGRGPHLAQHRAADLHSAAPPGRPAGARGSRAGARASAPDVSWPRRRTRARTIRSPRAPRLRRRTGDLVADARVAELADPQSRVDVLRESEPARVRAVRLGADPDHVAVVDVQAALGDQPAVDHRVEERVVLDVVDVPVDVVVGPPGLQGRQVRVAAAPPRGSGSCAVSRQASPRA